MQYKFPYTLTLSGFESLRAHKKKITDTENGVRYLGAPEGTRTPDLLIRSQALYPAELRARVE